MPRVLCKVHRAGGKGGGIDIYKRTIKNTATLKGENNMKKPERRTLREIQEKKYFVDFLYATYEPKKNSAGEYFHNGLDYTTNETESYMASAIEKEFVEKYGLAPIAFLEILRKEMAKTSGFGICITNRDLKKALMSIEIDYGVQQEELYVYYNNLLENQLIFKIYDSMDNEYVSTIQQLFNWEYKMWTRANNNAYQKKKRSKEKENIDLCVETLDDGNCPVITQDVMLKRFSEDVFSGVNPEDFF